MLRAWGRDVGEHLTLQQAREPAVPVIAAGEYGYERVNVVDQDADPSSILNWMRALISTRKECPEIGDGRTLLVPVEDPCVLAVRHERGASNVIALTNLSDEPRTATPGFDGRNAEDVLRDDRCRELNGAAGTAPLAGLGYRWIRVHEDE